MGADAEFQSQTLGSDQGVLKKTGRKVWRNQRGQGLDTTYRINWARFMCVHRDQGACRVWPNFLIYYGWMAWCSFGPPNSERVFLLYACGIIFSHTGSSRPALIKLHIPGLTVAYYAMVDWCPSESFYFFFFLRKDWVCSVLGQEEWQKERMRKGRKEKKNNRDKIYERIRNKITKKPKQTTKTKTTISYHLLPVPMAVRI